VVPLDPGGDIDQRGKAQRAAHGDGVACVWTGRPLAGQRIEVDHCLPWAAWPCNDLWNLLPASRDANQAKSDRVVTAAMLSEARPRILEWWQRGYLEAGEATRLRFLEEARSTLPVPDDRDPGLDDLFAALDFRRLRLRQETQVPEWAGMGEPRHA
jgi:hypothetical protein